MPVTNADDMLELFRRLKMVEQRAGQIYDQVACTLVPLATPIVVYNAAVFSTVGTSTEITAAAGGWLAVARGLEVRLLVKDSAAGGSTNFVIGPSATYYYAVSAYPAVNNVYAPGSGSFLPTDANGSVWYRCAASGAGTLTVILQVWGYFL